MASLKFTAMSLRPPDFSPGTGNYRNAAAVKLHLRKKRISVSVAANSPEEPSPAPPPEKPEIELEFIGVQLTFEFCLEL
jgi:hypothetical protein